MKQRIRTFIALALPVQIILVKWVSHYPEFVETYYSNGLYPIISRVLRMLLGWIPFSVGDLLYATLVLLGIRYVYLHWKSIKKHPLYFTRDLLAVLSIGYFAFYSLWGLNYYRQPITWKLGIEKKYTLEELVVFTEYLARMTNQHQIEITGDPAAPVQIPYTRKEIFKKTEEGYAALEKEYPAFAYNSASLKASLFSIPLTYMGYGGYLNPFSNEAQVNGQLPMLRMSVVSGHEVGHQLGYSAEDATSFIGFLVTVRHTDLYFTYSAYHYALGYCLSRLAVNDKKKYQEIIALLHPGVKKNFQEIQLFWRRHENPLEPLFKSAFNAFLKVNLQKEGLESYSAVVGLLINYYHKNGFWIGEDKEEI